MFSVFAVFFQDRYMNYDAGKDKYQRAELQYVGTVFYEKAVCYKHRCSGIDQP